MVEQHCGVPREVFLKAAEAFTSASGLEKTGAICYAVGWTQHSKGVQIIRSAAILQLLLGNIGRPGGGIMAMRRHASIQGSTDIPTLYNILPGYLPQPASVRDHGTLAEYLEQEKVETGYWAKMPAFMVSLLKAWYGEHATAETDYGFHHIGRIDDNYSQLSHFIRMAEGHVRGLFLFGQNPAGGAPNA